MGKNFCGGRSAREINNCLEIQNIFTKFRDYCRSLNISESIIENVRCHSVLITQDLECCKTYDKIILSLLKFSRENSNKVIINVDKSVDIVILYKEEYHKKLSDAFENNQNFEKITKI